MPWQVRGQKRYYTRSKKVNGRVKREYVGTGSVGELAAAADALRRAERRAQADARRAEEARWQSASGPLLELVRASGLLTRAALLAAGYHQHARGSWRRRHVGNHTDHGDARTRTG
jgi:hypothetical protein